VPDRFPLERAFVAEEHRGPTVLGLVALGILLRLAFGRSSDDRFAAEQIHRMMRSRR
jgi:hypothetical protein